MKRLMLCAQHHLNPSELCDNCWRHARINQMSIGQYFTACFERAAQKKDQAAFQRQAPKGTWS